MRLPGRGYLGSGLHAGRAYPQHWDNSTPGDLRRQSTDGDTAQVGPELAEMLAIPCHRPIPPGSQEIGSGEIRSRRHDRRRI